MSAAIAKGRLIRVLADDHGRGTRCLTARDIATTAVAMLREPPVIPGWSYEPDAFRDGEPMRIKVHQLALDEGIA
jgi:hypothetical protein